ncbi:MULTISPECIES: hypothetical protein [unclassified Nostoc]|uniref:hypothetical protein n=1 Tax=unclassified Nostoc TaxID=2593658 RepID=UPI0025DE6D13|nr:MULTISPECIES: hypothetical protein [unclassified Nostoc]
MTEEAGGSGKESEIITATRVSEQIHLCIGISPCSLPPAPYSLPPALFLLLTSLNFGSNLGTTAWENTSLAIAANPFKYRRKPKNNNGSKFS